MKTPDITPAQIVTIVQAIVALVAAFGLPVSDDVRDGILQLATAIAVVLPLADAHVRNGRARGNTMH